MRETPRLITHHPLGDRAISVTEKHCNLEHMCSSFTLRQDLACVCVCMYGCVSACVRTCVCASMYVCLCMCLSTHITLKRGQNVGLSVCVWGGGWGELPRSSERSREGRWTGADWARLVLSRLASTWSAWEAQLPSFTSPFHLSRLSSGALISRGASNTLWLRGLRPA